MCSMHMILSFYGLVSGFGFLLEGALLSGPGVGQYRVNLDRSCCVHSQRWTSEQMIADMEQQQLDAAMEKSSSGNRFAPAWEKQRVFVSVPTQEESSGKEWRLVSRVVSIGQVMLALGDEFSARDIELLWQSMLIAAEKAQMKDTRGKKRATAD